MIVLDTNVLSELIKSEPDPVVAAWSESSSLEHLITAITAGELIRGAHQLEQGKRRESLFLALSWQLSNFEMRGGILPFDTRAAWHFGEITAARRSLGRPIADADAMIAAVCRTHDAPLATRNVKDFLHTGVELLNPWD